jgi:hypothetical protein
MFLTGATSPAPSRPLRTSGRKEPTSISFFYEIRTPDNSVLKRNGGFPDREAATNAAREDAKRLKAVPKPPTVGRIIVGQNTDQPTRY